MIKRTHLRLLSIKFKNLKAKIGLKFLNFGKKLKTHQISLSENQAGTREKPSLSDLLDPCM